MRRTKECGSLNLVQEHLTVTESRVCKVALAKGLQGLGIKCRFE